MSLYVRQLADIKERMSTPISKPYECGCIGIDSDAWSILDNDYKAELCAKCLFACAKMIITE